MGLSDYLIMLRFRWRLFGGVVLLVLLAVGLVVTSLTPAWTTVATVNISTATPDSDDPATRQVVSSTAVPQTVISSFAEAVDSALVLEPVITRFGLDTSSEQLGERIQAYSPLGTSIVRIRVTDPDPRQAARLANAVAARLDQVAARLAPGEGGSAVTVGTIAPAGVPAAPSSPQRQLSMVLALLWGMGLAFVICVWVDARRPLVRTRKDVEAITSVPLIGYLPRDDVSAAGGRPRHDAASRVQWGQLRTNFLSLRDGYGFRSVAFVAPHDRAVTARISYHLADTALQNGHRVLIVDADLRAGQRAVPGLSSVLRGETPFAEAVVERLDRPATLPPGPRVRDSGSALSSPQMARFVETVTEDYDLVVFQVPPLAVNGDAAALAQVVDAVLLVAEHQPMPSALLRDSLSRLHLAGARIHGVVLSA